MTLRVDGLACPFCAYGLEKKLTALQGFKKKTYEVEINEGKVLFGWRNQKPLDIVGISTAVDKAGFTLRAIRIIIVGKVAKKDGRYILVLPKPLKQRYNLYDPKAVKNFNSRDLHGREGLDSLLTNDLRKRLDEAIRNGRSVRIIGPVHVPKVEKPARTALGIEALKVLKPVRPRSG